MSSLHLAFLAATVELGTPVVLAGLFFVRATSRHRLSVLLGAVTLPTLAYAWEALQHVVPIEPGSPILLSAIWLFSFIPFVATLVVGVALTLASQQQKLGRRFALGLISAPVGFVLSVMVGNLVAMAA